MRPTIHPVHTPCLPSAPLADHAPVLVRTQDQPTPSRPLGSDVVLPDLRPLLAQLPG